MSGVKRAEQLAERLLGRRKKGAAHNPDTGPNGHSGRHDPQEAAKPRDDGILPPRNRLHGREARDPLQAQSAVRGHPPPQSALQKPQKRSIKTKDAYLKIQADPAPATPPSALQQGKASFVQERQGTLLRSGKLDRRLPAGEDVPSAAPPSGKRPQGMDIHKQPRQVSGQAGGSRVQSKPHRGTPRQAMGGTAKTAVKERGAPVKQAAHPVRKTAGLGLESQVGNHRQGHSRPARPAVQQRREPGWHELRKQQKRPV